MLAIHNIETIDSSKLNIHKRKTKKTQILLYDTERRVDDFIAKIKYRQNEKYEDIPHFVVSKLGFVYQIFDTNYSSTTFRNSTIDKRIIKVAIENLGWLNKNTITGVLNNWIGDPYRAEPYVRTWRGHFFWDKYPESQMEAVSQLCDYLCENNNIPKQVVPSNGYLEKAANFKGVVCKSNFADIYTDINPSFNFRIFFNDAKEIS
jgi:hypothetical protein